MIFHTKAEHNESGKKRKKKEFSEKFFLLYAAISRGYATTEGEKNICGSSRKHCLSSICFLLAKQKRTKPKKRMKISHVCIRDFFSLHFSLFCRPTSLMMYLDVCSWFAYFFVFSYCGISAGSKG